MYGSNGVVGWHDKALTRGATIVIGRKGSIGEVNWSNGPCFPIDTTYYVEKTERPCDLRWLYYHWLRHGHASQWGLVAKTSLPSGQQTPRESRTRQIKLTACAKR